MPDEADDLLDGCELDFAEDSDDEETAVLRPLFPQGRSAFPSEEELLAKAEEWKAVLGGA